MIEFERRATGTVANPDVGSDVLFLDAAGVFYTKDSSGVLTVLGRGIVSIAKTGTVGLVDTYTITFSGGTTQDYTVTNGDDGRSIVSVTRTAGTGAPGTTDTYTITYSEAPLTSTFTVYNGANGLDGSGQPAQNAPAKIDPDDASAIGTRTAFYALEDHQHQIDAGTPVALGAAAAEGTSSAFARADHVHVNPVIAHEAAGDPHPQYTTTAEASAAAPVQSVSAGLGVSVNASTGAVIVTSDLAQNIFFAGDYGTLTSGVDTATVAGAQATQNRTTIQAAINACASNAGGKKPGGIVLLPPGTFHIDDTLTISTSGVQLVGAGSYSNSDTGAQSGFGTTLFWNNTASPATTAMVKVASVAGAANPAVKRAGVEGITLQCAGNVGRGLWVQSIHFGRFQDLYIINATNQGVFADCLLTTTQLGEAADNTKCVFEDISIRMIEAGASATGMRLDGATNANTSNSTFRNIAVLCQGAQIALDLGNTDSNHFYSIVINQSNGATVQPVRLRGGTAGGLECRGNVFYYLAAGGSSNGTRGMYNEGTEIAGITAPAKNNAVFGYSIENGEPYPIIGTGATLFYQIVGGTQPFKLNSTLLADTAFTNAVIPTVASLVIPANAITPGTTFEFTMVGSVINTTAASNLVCDILINGVAVATATLALGTTAAASPGRGFWYQGSVTFRTVGASGTVSSNGRIEVAALGNGSNQTAPTAVNTTAAVTLAMRINTSAATSTGTVRQATIIQGN